MGLKFHSIPSNIKMYEVYLKSNATVFIAPPTFMWETAWLTIIFSYIHDWQKWWRWRFPPEQQGVHSQLPLPSPAALTRVKDFVAGLTRAEISYSEIKSMTECAFGVKSLHKSFTFCFIIKFKAGKSAEEEYNFNLRGLWILLPLSPPPCWKRCPFHCEGSCPGPSGFC